MTKPDNFILEEGDFFTICTPPQKFTTPAGLEVEIEAEMEGIVFEAKCVNNSFAACKIIERGNEDDKGDLVVSLNWQRHKIAPLTKEYADIIRGSRSLPKQFEDFHPEFQQDPEMPFSPGPEDMMDGP